MLNRPHHLNPTKESVRVILAYKNFAANQNISHIGLGVAALNNSQVLRANGVWADVVPVLSALDIATKLTASNAAAAATNSVPVSHVVISAPWIPTNELAGLASAHPDVHFAVISHSNVAFLHADPKGARLLTEAIGLQKQWPNFRMGGNSRKFCEWLKRAYGADPVHLPNLYHLAAGLERRGVAHREFWSATRVEEPCDLRGGSGGDRAAAGGGHGVLDEQRPQRRVRRDG
jgi:hypothetical protein